MITYYLLKVFQWIGTIIPYIFFWFILDEIGASDTLYKLFFALIAVDIILRLISWKINREMSE